MPCDWRNFSKECSSGAVFLCLPDYFQFGIGNAFGHFYGVFPGYAVSLECAEHDVDVRNADFLPGDYPAEQPQGYASSESVILF